MGQAFGGGHRRSGGSSVRRLRGAAALSRPASARRLWLLAIFAVTLLVYLNALPNGFVYDDHFLVEGNRLIQQRDVSGIFTTHYWEGGNPANASGHYRPLTILSLLVDGLGGISPFRYHLSNVLLHAFNALLAFGICRVAGLGLSGAGVAGLLFAVHPVHAEAAAGVTSGRADLLAALFVLCGLLTYLLFLKQRRRCDYGLAIASFSLGLLSKESALVLIGLVPFADFVLARYDAQAGMLRRVAAVLRDGWARWLGFAAVFVLYLFVRRWAANLGFSAGSVSVVMHPLLNATVWVRLLTAAKLFWDYLALVAVPWRLSVDYSYNAIPVAGSAWEPDVVLGVAAAALVGLLWLRAFGRHPRVFFAGALFLVPYSAVSQTLVLLNSMFQERYVYLPVLGLFALAGLGAERLLRVRRRAAAVLVGLVLLAYAGRTAARNRDWRDDETLFSSALAAYPESARMHQALGELQAARGDMPSAIQSFLRAADILPVADTYNNLGNAYGVMGDSERAMAAYRKAVELEPGYGEAWSNLGMTALRTGDLQAAIRAYSRSADLMPDDAQARYNLGVALAEAGDSRRAIDAYRRALTLRPRWPQASFNLANLLWDGGNRRAAVARYRQFLQIWSQEDAAALLARERIAEAGGLQAPH